MKLNVCLLNDSFPPLIDGVANTVINYAENIHTRLGRCSVVTPKYPAVYDHYDFPVIRYPSINLQKLVGYRAGYPFGARTLKKLEDQHFDIIHSHCPMASGLLARTLRERVDAPLILTYHTKFDIEIAKVLPTESLQSIATKLLINNIHACDEVWAVSNGAAENMRSMGYQGEVVIMENGVDFPCETIPPEQCLALRKELGIAPEETVFLFVGRCMWYKGFRPALEALQKVRAAGHPFKYVVVGDGADRKEISAYAEQLGLKDLCLFVGSIQDRALLRRYFGMADLFLFPSTFDTNGLVVREAAGTALGSLIIEDSCAAEGIIHLQNGILAKENADDIADKLCHICENKALAEKIGKAAQKEIYISWSDAVDKAYRRYEYLYERMQSGQMPRKDTKGNSVFELLSDLSAGLNKLMNVPGAVKAKSGQIYHKLKK